MKAGQIDKGTALLIKGQPFICVDREFVSPGKGSAFVRLKLKSPGSSQGLAITMKSQDNVEEIVVDEIDYQYMYNDGESFFMMNVENFEQIEIPMKDFPDYQFFMKEGETYRCQVYDQKVLDISIPSKEIFIVADAQEAIKGDTVQGATKLVTTDTGLTVKVPIFIKKGEKIRVNTETKEYLERVNN